MDRRNLDHLKRRAVEEERLARIAAGDGDGRDRHRRLAARYRTLVRDAELAILPLARIAVPQADAR